MSEPRKVPLVEIVKADLKPATRALDRIADALETYLRLEHNYHTSAPAPLAPGSREHESLEYYSENDALTQEAREALGLDPPNKEQEQAEEGEP